MKPEKPLESHPPTFSSSPQQCLTLLPPQTAEARGVVFARIRRPDHVLCFSSMYTPEGTDFSTRQVLVLQVQFVHKVARNWLLCDSLRPTERVSTNFYASGRVRWCRGSENLCREIRSGFSTRYCNRGVFKHRKWIRPGLPPDLDSRLLHPT